MADGGPLTQATGRTRHGEALARDRRYVWHCWSPVDRPPDEVILLDRGEGYHVWDLQGRRYVDAVAGAMNSSCGYGDKRIIDAAVHQLARLPHYDLSAGGHEVVGLLAERLAGLLPGDLHRTFFTNSGSEATEVAVRMAVDYWLNQGVDRRRIVSFEAGYHGTTALAQALSGLPAALPDLPVALPITKVPLPLPATRLRHPEALPVLLDAFARAVHADNGGADVAAVIVEPLLNVGGGIILPSGFLAGLRRLCDETGALLIVDEVFTGFGRTGRMFGFECDAITPDLVMMSKGVSSGYAPLGAVTTTAAVFDVFRHDAVFGGLRYGHTTSGHALACAVGASTIDVLCSDGLVDNAAVRGAQLLERLEPLRTLPGVVDVRGDGLVVVLETPSQAEAYRLLLIARRHGVLLRAQNRSLLAIPPLVIDTAGIDELADGVSESVREFSRAPKMVTDGQGE